MSFQLVNKLNHDFQRKKTSSLETYFIYIVIATSLTIAIFFCLYIFMCRRPSRPRQPLADGGLENSNDALIDSAAPPTNAGTQPPSVVQPVSWGMLSS